MADIETLTDEERQDLEYMGRGAETGDGLVCVAKALRIIDAQAERVRELEAELRAAYLMAEQRRQDALTEAGHAIASEDRVRELETEALMAKGLIQGLVAERDAAESELAQLRESIERARAILVEGRAVDSPESRLASDLREVLGGH